MTDNKITREMTFSEELPYFKERIKEVFDNYNNPNGYEDPLYIAVLRDSKRIVRKAEEEITRQQAEISEWKEKYVKNFEKWELLDRRTKQFYAELYEEAKDVVKSESIKEFAERLKETKFKHGNDYIIYADNIDTLLKEMVGENNA